MLVAGFFECVKFRLQLSVSAELRIKSYPADSSIFGIGDPVQDVIASNWNDASEPVTEVVPSRTVLGVLDRVRRSSNVRSTTAP
jgi:hypothetical protein